MSGLVRRMKNRVLATPLGGLNLFRRSVGGGSAGSIRGRGPFDVVVIDGIERAACARACLDELDARGVIVWDNAEYDEFRETVDFLAEHGFRYVPFFGLGPVGIVPWTTAVLYRDSNCIGL